MTFQDKAKEILNDSFPDTEVWNQAKDDALAQLTAAHEEALIAQLEGVSDRLDDLHQGTEGAGFVHYGEMGEWLDDRIATLKKGQDNERK